MPALARPAEGAGPAPPHAKVWQVGVGRQAAYSCHTSYSSKVTLPVPPSSQHSPREGPQRTTSEIALGMVFIHLDTVQILQFPFAAKSIKIIFI